MITPEYIRLSSVDTASECQRCDGQGWVCENHQDLPWDGMSIREDACHCGGAGAPCPDCNPLSAEKGSPE